jgi:hypothetical protein
MAIDSAERCQRQPWLVTERPQHGDAPRVMDATPLPARLSAEDVGVGAQRFAVGAIATHLDDALTRRSSQIQPAIVVSRVLSPGRPYDSRARL